MDSTPVVEVLPEVIELMIVGIGSVALTVVGALVERFALITALEGQPALGGWFAVMGGMALLFAYLLFTDKFRPKLESLWVDYTDA
jgi:ribulose 1,5-bisphosphate synthetase/thiazole synthase